MTLEEALKRLEWKAQDLKKFSDDGRYMGLRSELSSGTCYELGVEILQEIAAIKESLANHIEYNLTMAAQPEHEFVCGECVKCGASIERQEPVAWTDKADEWSDEIALHHPFKTEAYKQWDTAMAMVGARHSKGALVELVCWLLQKSTPPQRKPLTDKQIKQLLKTMHGEPYPNDLYAFSRAIEAAHGIKE